MRPFIQPGGSTQPTLPPTQTYRQPVGTLQQTPPVQLSQPTPPETTPTPQGEPAQANDPHRAVLTAWHAHHADAWIRADALHPAVRRMIDPKDRPDAIRQRLRLLAATCHQLEARRGGTPTLPVKLYRLAPP